MSVRKWFLVIVLLLISCTGVTAQNSGIGNCNYPTVAQGTETNRNIFCPSEPNMGNPDTYGTCSTDIVYWPAPMGSRTVRACAVPVFCSLTTYLDRFWSTTSIQTGQYTWTYWSRWNVRAGKIENGQQVAIDYQYTESCMRSAPSPIAIKFDAGADLSMTNPQQKCTMFAIEGQNTPRLCLGWLVPESNQAWLVLDRNGNSTIDDGSELFGDRTPQAEAIGNESRNGYRSLRIYDLRENGGNENGEIDSGDLIYTALQLWFDRNGNGQCESGELLPLSYLVKTFSLDYKRVGRRDQFGNGHTLRADLELLSGEKRFSYDVYPAVNDSGNEVLDMGRTIR